MWFDSHCHLHLCDGATTEQILDHARDAGVANVVTVGTDPGSSRAAVASTEDDRVYAVAGVHPNSANEWDGAARSEIERLLASPRVVGVGESGLDFYRDHVEPAQQERAFRDHIALAKEHDKALVIHTRSSVDTALDLLVAEGPPQRFVFHCWSGDDDQLRRALDLGAYVSFAGNVSFKTAQNLREAAALVPPDRLLVETDSPYLAPVPFRGKANEPARVVFVGEAVAAARGEDTGVVARRTTDNALRLFGLG